MSASLHGVRVACFYPWNAFEPTGAWSRFCCLWQFLLSEGADVTLAFFEKGRDIDLKDLSIRYTGEDSVFLDGAALQQEFRAMRSSGAPHKKFTDAELLFSLLYEKRMLLRNPKTGPWLEKIIAEHDLVTCDYPMFAPALSEYCQRAGKPLVVTCLDLLYELHGSSPQAKQLLKEKELHALGLADALVFCNDGERQKLTAHGLDGAVVLNTGDALAVEPFDDDQCRENVRAELHFKTRHYCLFVGSNHAPNVQAVKEIKQLARKMPEMTFIVAGDSHKQATEGNFMAVGRVPHHLLDRLYRGSLAIIIPLIRGTGNSVKLFQAFIYQKPLVSTPIGARGHDVSDGQELLITPTPNQFPAALRRLINDEGLRRRIAQAGRAYALEHDFRKHFQPYADIICRLLDRPRTAKTLPARSMVLVDNNLTDRIGHHSNYALSIKNVCAEVDVPFASLVKRDAEPDLLEALSAVGVFTQGIHEESPTNPFPRDWGQVCARYEFLSANTRFAEELEAGLNHHVRLGDLVFVPNATQNQILGLALMLKTQPIFLSLRYVLILRFSVFTANGPLAARKPILDKETAEKYAMALTHLDNADQAGVVRLATDSAELAKEFGALIKRPIEVLPIPHTSQPIPAESPAIIPPKPANRRRVVYMGDARDEKGFEFLPTLIKAAKGTAAFNNVEFVLQAFISSPYHIRMVPVIDELKQLVSPQLHLITQSLDGDAYHTLLDSADLVLLPYDAATYRSRTSGPFVEAICAGKPVVAPRNSWLSGQLGESKAGVTFLSGNAQDFVRAAKVAVAQLPALTTAAGVAGKRYRELHNPRNFLRCLLNRPEPTMTPQRRAA